jgi:ribonuclease HI
VKTLITYSDGGARGNPGPAAIGAVICDEKNNVVFETARCIGATTNNQAEYRAMLMALELAKEQGAQVVKSFADSELLIFQLQGVYRIKDSNLKVLAEKVKSLANQFRSITYRQVPRENPMIARADKLLNQALNRGASAGLPSTPPKEPKQGELF